MNSPIDRLARPRRFRGESDASRAALPRPSRRSTLPPTSLRFAERQAESEREDDAGRFGQLVANLCQNFLEDLLRFRLYRLSLCVQVCMYSGEEFNEAVD